MDAYDSDVLIYAAQNKPIGRVAVRRLRDGDPGVGSVVLLPEVLAKPKRLGDEAEERAAIELLACLDLKPVDEEIADAATTFAAYYGLRAADAIHLATAVVWGAERFHTNNRRDFGPHITEIEVVWPEP